MDASIQRSARDATMRVVAKTASVGERVEDRIGRLRAAFQAELVGVIDRLATAAVSEADAAAERVRAAGQTALDAALIELEGRARQSDDLTKSVRQLKTQIEELRLALHAERELVKTATHKCEQEHNARARAEAATEEARRLQERFESEYESKLQAAQTVLDAERARSGGLKRQLEAHVAERARLLTAFATVRQACALAETNSEAFDVARQRAEEQSADETEPDVHNQSAAMSRDDGAGANEPSAGKSVMRDLVTSAAADSQAGRKMKFVEQPAVNVPPTLAEYATQLFPRETPGTGPSSAVKTEGGTTRKSQSRRFL
jgi:DNA repair exonuclease SbcCD ATPase subunit